MSKELTREQLSDAGAHLGHQTKRWNPKMKPYIYAAKNKNHIIDLQQTMWKIEDVKKFVTTIGLKKEKILFVGTKKTAKNAVKEAALRSGNFFVNSRWLGGTLTNMKTISLRIKALWNIENEEKTGKINLRPKKEQVLIKKEKAKLEKTLGGIKQMVKLPAAMFVVDPKTDEIAVKEARKLRIPVIGICDTNVDPDMVDYVIPANDDIPEAVNLIVNNIIEAYADAAGIKMQPTTLKVVAQKREEGQQRPFNKDRFDRRDRPERKEYTDRKDYSEKPAFAKQDKPAVEAVKVETPVVEEKPAKEVKVEETKAEKPAKETKAKAEKTEKPVKEAKAKAEKPAKEAKVKIEKEEKPAKEVKAKAPKAEKPAKEVKTKAKDAE